MTDPSSPRRRVRSGFRSRPLRCVAAVATIGVGLFVLATALAQPLKANLGHALLEGRFDDRMAADAVAQNDASQWRPWPWADLAPIAELHFPEAGERRVVVDSASGEALAWAVGHVPGTAAPGGPGVSAIAGHRDGRFELLGDVGLGETVELTTLDGETVRYIVEERVVVNSETVELPIVHDGPDELILTTCWPIDGLVSGPERLLVRASRTA